MLKRPGGWTLGALALVALWPTRQQVFLGKAYYFRDVHLVWHAHMESLVRVVMAGAWPLWNPLPGFGQPLLGDPDYMAAYPLTWLNFVLRPWVYYTVFVVLHLFWSALGTYLLARLWRCSEAAALTGAALWTLSGPLLSSLCLWHHFAAACWAPWVFLAAERTFSTRRWRWAGIWAAVSGLQILTGSADVVAMTLTALAVHTAVVRWRWRTPLAPSNRRLAATAAVALLVAVGLGAVQIGAALDVLRTSPRREQGASTRTYWSVKPVLVADAVAPALFATLPLGTAARAYLYESREPFLATLYLGAGTLPLTGAALLRPRRRVLALALIVVGALLVSFGRFAPFYGILMAIAPPLRILRYPVKAWLLLAFAWALLCAHGMDVWRSARPLARRAWAAGVVVPPLIAGTAFLALALFTWREPLEVAARMLGPRGTGADAARLLAPVTGRLCVAALAAGTAVASGIAALRRPAWRPVLGPAMALLAVGELAFELRNLDPGIDRMLYARPPVVDVLRAQGARRIYSYDYYSSPELEAILEADGVWGLARLPPGWTEDQGYALQQELHLALGSAVRWGIATGYERDAHNLAPSDLTQMVLLLPELEGTPVHLRFLRMAGITHVVSLHASPFSELRPVATLDSLYVKPVRVFEVPRPLPRAYVVAGARPAEGRAAFAELVAPGFDPEREVVLSHGPASAAPPLTAQAAGTAVIDEQRPDRLRLRVDAAAAGHLVVLEGYDPAWKAEVDGRPAPVLRANIAFLAVPLSPGRHVVGLRYRPRGALVGLVVSAASVAACLALVRVRS